MFGMEQFSAIGGGKFLFEFNMQLKTYRNQSHRLSGIVPLVGRRKKNANIFGCMLTKSKLVNSFAHPEEV